MTSPTNKVKLGGLKRGPWTREEDEILENYIKKQGEGKWRTLPKKAGLLRCGKSCRLRWMNYLRPSVKRGHISLDEEDLILRLHRLLGNRWSLIAGRIPGRTDNEIKNYWNTHLSKKLISQGIDPKTHKPLINSIDVRNSKKDCSSIKENEGNVNTIPDNIYIPFQMEEPVSHHGYDQSSNGMLANYGDDHRNKTVDDELNCCAEDHMLSSFLNSLINEDMFNAQNQQLLANTISPDFDPSVPSSASPSDQNNTKRHE